MDLGAVAAVHAESFGEPGQRTFRLLVETQDGRVSIWLEKEQVVMLGTAVDEVLERVPGMPLMESEAPGPPVLHGDVEVRAGSLAVGYDPGRSGYTIEASEFTSPFELESIALRTDRAGFKQLTQEIAEIVSASRPRCPLCGTPLSDGPHFCPESNGHTEVAATD